MVASVTSQELRRSSGGSSQELHRSASGDAHDLRRSSSGGSSLSARGLTHSSQVASGAPPRLPFKPHVRHEEMVPQALEKVSSSERLGVQVSRFSRDRAKVVPEVRDLGILGPSADDAKKAAKFEIVSMESRISVVGGVLRRTSTRDATAPTARRRWGSQTARH